MKIFLFYFEMAIKLQGWHKIIGSVGLAVTHLFFRPKLNWSSLYALLVFKIRYNETCPFLTQNPNADIQNLCLFKCYVSCFKRRQCN